MNLSVNWGLRIKTSVYKETDKFPRKDSERIIFAIEQLSLNPYDGDIEKMKGEDNIWRRRIGNYRIFYEVKNNKKEVYVFHVERRASNTY